MSWSISVTAADRRMDTRKRVQSFITKGLGRILTYFVILLVHSLLLVWFINSAPEIEPYAPSASSVAVMIIPTEALPRVQQGEKKQLRAAIFEPLSLPAKLPDSTGIILTPLPALDAQSSACDIAGSIQSTLRGSSAIRVALANLPPSAKSVANALMVWDGHWLGSPTAAVSYPLLQIKGSIIEAIRDAPSNCREEAQSGPRFFIVPGPPDTVIALGSGKWRWIDMSLPSDNPVKAADD